MTNGDRIRQMSNEELAESRVCVRWCYGECTYMPVGARGIYYDKEKAIQAELQWLNQEHKV